MHAAIPSLTRSRSQQQQQQQQQQQVAQQKRGFVTASYPSPPFPPQDTMARGSNGASDNRQKHGGVVTPSAAVQSTSMSNVSFSAFLMDEIPDLTVRPQRNGAQMSTTTLLHNGAPAAIPTATPLPTLAAQKSMSPPPPAVVISTGKREDDIPVLEATKDGAFHSDFDDDDDDDDDEEDIIVGDDDSDDDDDDEDVDTFNADDYVPVLQTAEDAQAFDKAVRQKTVGAKKFSWRESSRQVAKRKKSRAKKANVPDPETLLRMSTRPTELISNSSSGSLISRKASSISVDKQLVRSGWLYKQADIMYVVPAALCRVRSGGVADCFYADLLVQQENMEAPVFRAREAYEHKHRGVFSNAAILQRNQLCEAARRGAPAGWSSDCSLLRAP